MIGGVLLKVDKIPDPLNTPLRDTRDVVERLQNLCVEEDVVCTTLDFSAIYTNISWSNMIEAAEFWVSWIKANVRVLGHILSQEEIDLLYVFISSLDITTYLS